MVECMLRINDGAHVASLLRERHRQVRNGGLPCVLVSEKLVVASECPAAPCNPVQRQRTCRNPLDSEIRIGAYTDSVIQFQCSIYLRRKRLGSGVLFPRRHWGQPQHGRLTGQEASAGCGLLLGRFHRYPEQRWYTCPP